MTIPALESGLVKLRRIGNGAKCHIDEKLPTPKEATVLLAKIEVADKLVEFLVDLRAASRGVAGYHLNGDIAEWDEFEEMNLLADYRNPAPVAHTCHWPGCEKHVPPAMWGCKGHWFSLPKRLRDRIWKTYRPGQEITKTPSPEYVEAAQEVQRWITEFRAGNNHGAKP